MRLISNRLIDIENYISLRLQEPVQLPSFTVANLPAAANHTNRAVIVSDETGGRTIATSDGTNWRRVSDGAIAS